MAQTAIADIINPEVLADQLSAKYPDHLVLAKTGLVAVNGDFPLGSPGSQFKMPFWRRIGAFADQTEGTAATPGKITASSEYATVLRGSLALEVLDTAELVSKADPVAEVAGQIGRRAAEYIDGKLVVAAGSTPNVFDQTSSTAQSNVAGTLDQNAIARGLLTLGDNYGTLQTSGAIIMHSKPYFDLVQTGTIQNQYQSGMNVIKEGTVGTLMGLPVLVSDMVPVTTVAGPPVKTVYTSYVLGPGALGLIFQRQVMVEFDRDILLQADVIMSTVHFAAHLYGYDEKTSAVVAEQNKSIHVVKITSY